MKVGNKNGDELILKEMIKRHPELEGLQTALRDSYLILKEAFENGKKLLICGNGGSAADADHIVGELMKGFLKERKLSPENKKMYGNLAAGLQEALPAIALTQHTALSTAYGNDVRADMIFAQQVYGYGSEGDVLWVISTSGNSANVVNAAEVAVARRLKVISMTGKGGGALKEISHKCIAVPEVKTPYVQEQHIILYHALCAMLEEYFFPE